MAKEIIPNSNDHGDGVTLASGHRKRRALRRGGLVLAVIGSMVSPSAAWAQEIHIAAVVNDDVITTSDLNARRDLIITTNAMPNTVEVQQKITPRLLDGLITETLQMQEAKRLSIDISDAEVNGAMEKIDAARHQPAGSMARFIVAHPALKPTVLAQIRAQLAWNRVVERKIKRSITIADDEITRAQIARAAAGIEEVRIEAISLPIRGAKDEARVAKLAKTLSAQLNQGSDFITLAKQMAGSNQAQLNPPVWVAETELQPAMQQAIRTLKPGQITQPLRSQSSFQLIHLLDRRNSKLQSDDTEVALKQISIPLPAKQDTAGYAAARALTQQLRARPGSCDDTKIENGGGATATLLRAKYSQLSPDLRRVVEHLNVGEASESLLGDTDVKLMLLCERVDGTGALPPAEDVRRQLFSEKLELEAEKYLRNLRRDAFIDIKGDK